MTVPSPLPRSTTWQYATSSYPRCSFCQRGMARYSCGVGTLGNTVQYQSCGYAVCWRRLLCVSATYRVVGAVPDAVMQYSDYEVCSALVEFGRDVVAKYETVMDADWQEIMRMAASTVSNASGVLNDEAVQIEVVAQKTNVREKETR